MAPQRIIQRVENRVSIGLFRPMMMLFYICFITFFLIQSISAETKPLTFNTEKDLKVVEAANYRDGTILLRLSNPSNCNAKNLWFNIISPDGTSNSLTVDKHSIPQDNFCSNKPLITKRHTACENGGGGSAECCSQYPDSCTDKPKAAANCQTNPGLNGCQSFCDNNPGECAAAKAKAKEQPKELPKELPKEQPKVPAKEQPKVPAKEQPAKTPVPVVPAKTPAETAKACATNPYGPGCNVDCGKNPIPAGCADIPRCSETPGVPGCNGGLLDCGTYPSSPQCACDNNPYSINCANVPDCNSTPAPPACANVPNCSQTPNIPGCVGDKLDCSMYPKSPDCKSLDCTSNPNAPGCGSSSVTDSIKIHAITNGFILVTYYCALSSSSTNICGSIINWSGFEVDTIKFEESCTDGMIVESINDKGFVYVCYKSESKQVFWNTFGAPINDGDVSPITTNTLSYNVDVFNSARSHVFATEDGGYSILTSTLSGTGATVSTSFIQKVSTNPVKGPFTIYTSNSQTLTDIRIYRCTIAYQSSGYSCLIKTTENQVDKYFNVDFLSNGNVVNTNEIDLTKITGGQVITDVQPLNFGGYVIVTTDSTTGKKNGYVIDNKGAYYKTWGLSDESYNSVLVLSNNTIVAIPSNAPDAGTTTTIITTDEVTSFATIEGGGGTAPGGPGGYGSSKIISTTPSKGETITIDGSKKREEFTITYTIPIIPSTGNFSIFQVNGTNGNGVLKQTVSAADSQFVSFDSSELIVQVFVLESVLNTKDGSYYVTVDNDFVKEKSNSQNVIGIRQKIWAFATTSTTAITGGGSDSAIIRLTPEGTRNYISLPSENRTKFEIAMTEGIAKSLPVEQERISTVGYQYDGHTKEDQVILRVDIRAATPQQTSSEQLVNNLNDMVINKDITPLSDGKSTSYLDASNGAPHAERLWPKYWWILLLAIILFISLIIIFIFARMKNKEGRNFLAIFLFAFIPIDLLLDIIFVSLHGRDFKWVLPVSLFFLLFPLILNIIFTYFIIKKEKTGKKFKKWWKKNPTTAKVFTAASCIDTDALQEVSSRAGGVEGLSAPFSPDGENKILFATGVVAFIEDLPQFIIYCVYLRYHIKWAMVPILVLSSCIIVLILKLFAITCYTCCYRREKGPQSDKENVISSDSSSSSSSSDEGEKIPFNPNTTDSSRLPNDGTQGERGPKPVDEYGNIPPEEEKDDEKPVESKPSAPADNKDAKKPGITAALFGGKKPKKPKKENEDNEEKIEKVENEKITTTHNIGTTKEEIKDNTTDTRTNVPERDSTIRESMVEAYSKYAETLENLGGDSAGASNSTVLGAAGYSSYGYGGGYRVDNGTKPTTTTTTTSTTSKTGGEPIIYGTSSSSITKDKLTGAAIAGVTVAGGATTTTRYYIIITEEDEKEEKEKTVVSTTTTSSDDGKGYITKTSSGEIYTTNLTDTTERKYITKSSTGGENYTTIQEGDKYITRTISGEEYITTITTITSTTTTTTTTSSDDKEYVTRPKSGKGGYIITKTSGVEIIEGGETITETSGVEIIEGDETTTTTYITRDGEDTVDPTRKPSKKTTKKFTDKNGITTITTTEIITEHGKTTTIITTVKVDQSGKEISSQSETYETEFVEEPESVDESEGTTATTTYTTRDQNVTTSSPRRKPTRKETKTTVDGIETIIMEDILIDENGKKTTKITTVKKDLSGKIISTDTQTYESNDTEFTNPEGGTITYTTGGNESEETTTTTTYVTGGDEIITSGPRTSAGSQTKTSSETDENGIETIITEETVTDENGKTTIKVTTVKKDRSGNEISSNTETRVSYEPITVATTKTTSKLGGSSSGPRTSAGTQTKTSSETDENGIETITTEETVTDENGKTTIKVTTVKKDRSGNEISSNTETRESHEPTTVATTKTTSIIGPSIYEESRAKKKKALAEKHTKSTTPSSSTKSIKRTSSYGRSGGKISRNKSGAKATTSSKVIRSGNKDRLGRVDSNSSMSSLSSTSSSSSSTTTE